MSRVDSPTVSSLRLVDPLNRTASPPAIFFNRKDCRSSAAPPRDSGRCRGRFSGIAPLILPMTASTIPARKSLYLVPRISTVHVENLELYGVYAFPAHQQDKPVPLVNGFHFEPAAPAGRSIGQHELLLPGAAYVVRLVCPAGVAFPEGVEAGHHGVFGGELAPVVDETQIDDKAEVGLVVRKIRGKQEIRECEFIKRQGTLPGFCSLAETVRPAATLRSSPMLNKLHTCALSVK